MSGEATECGSTADLRCDLRRRFCAPRFFAEADFAEPILRSRFCGAILRCQYLRRLNHPKGSSTRTTPLQSSTSPTAINQDCHSPCIPTTMAKHKPNYTQPHARHTPYPTSQH